MKWAAPNAKLNVSFDGRTPVPCLSLVFLSHCLQGPLRPPNISLSIASPAVAAGRLLPAIIVCLADAVAFDLLLHPEKKKQNKTNPMSLSLFILFQASFMGGAAPCGAGVCGQGTGAVPPATHPPSEQRAWGHLGGWEGSGRGQQGPPCSPHSVGLRTARHPPGLPLPSRCLPGTAYLGWTCFRGTAEMDAAH